MNIILIVIAIVLISFIVLDRTKPELLRSLFLKGKTNATVVSVEEKSETILNQHSRDLYFYPRITYSYRVDGNEYEVILEDNLKYRVSEISTFGGKRPDNEFFWRTLKPGMKLEIIFNRRNPKNSMIRRPISIVTE